MRNQYIKTLSLIQAVPQNYARYEFSGEIPPRILLLQEDTNANKFYVIFYDNVALEVILC